MSVRVVRTGVANLASVQAALVRVGADPVLCADPDRLRTADRVVLPGVGAFGAAMAELHRLGLVEALRERIREGRPTFAVCLGLQLFARQSEETPGVDGLGLIDAAVTRFVAPPGGDGLRVPQMGWNAVMPEADSRYLRRGFAYYANTFKLDAIPDGWTGARSVHGAPFVAALERGDVLACQFHPELSGPWGAALLARWVRGEAGPKAFSGAGGPPPATPPALREAEPGAAAAPAQGPVRIVPCLDVRDGRVVKGVKFQGLRDAGDPVERATAYEAGGADEIVILDVSATDEARAHGVEVVRAVRAALGVPLTVGGGVRTVEDAGRLLDAGADKVGVNTAAFHDPALLTRIAERYGAQCTVVAVDAARRVGTDGNPAEGWEVVIRAGKERTGRDAIAWAREAEARGAGEILLTSWDQDGTRAGYDLALLRAVRAAVSVPVIASGGAAHADHMADGVRAGADALLAASIFHDGETTPDTLKRALAEAGVSVRLGAVPNGATEPSP